MFGVFAGFAMLHAAAVWFATDHAWLVPIANLLSLMTVLSGAAGVLCSVMIYVKTRRPFWSIHRTAGQFVLTSLVLGLPVALLVSLATCYWFPELTSHAILESYGQSLCRWLMVAVTLKLLLEASVLGWLRSRQFTPLKRTALLLTGELSMTNLLRYFFGVMGGLLLPLVLLSNSATAAYPEGFQPLFLGFIVVLITLLLVIGEMIERYLFFAASVAPKMPGAPCT